MIAPHNHMIHHMPVYFSHVISHIYPTRSTKGSHAQSYFADISILRAATFSRLFLTTLRFIHFWPQWICMCACRQGRVCTCGVCIGMYTCACMSMCGRVCGMYTCACIGHVHVCVHVGHAWVCACTFEMCMGEYAQVGVHECACVHM